MFHLSGVKVSFDNARVKVKRFSDYVSLYVGKPCDAPRVEHCADRWRVALARSGSEGETPGFVQVSFVNGVCTAGGGTHVEHVMGQFLRTACALLANGKPPIPGLAPALRGALMLFVDATLVNPTFDSQSKETCNLPASRFGSPAPPSTTRFWPVR